MKVEGNINVCILQKQNVTPKFQKGNFKIIIIQLGMNLSQIFTRKEGAKREYIYGYCDMKTFFKN